MYTKKQLQQHAAGMRRSKLGKKLLNEMAENMNTETIDKAVMIGFYFVKKIQTDNRIELVLRDSHTGENERSRTIGHY